MLSGALSRSVSLSALFEKVRFGSSSNTPVIAAARPWLIGVGIYILVGLANGLAWTPYGGEVLQVEAQIMAGRGQLVLTGQLGDVMQESAQAALSYIRSRAKELGIKNSFYSSKDIHLHIPEGATPKDGPSAGITICAALVSALTDNQTKSDLAMTGEITLQGRVLAVGGLKEKLLAAKQHGIKTVIVSQENYDDIQEVLKETNLGDLQVVYTTTMDEVLKVALSKSKYRFLKTETTPTSSFFISTMRLMVFSLSETPGSAND